MDHGEGESSVSHDSLPGLWDFERQSFLESVLNSGTQVLPKGAGHYAMFEAPVALVTCIEAALSAPGAD